MKAIKKERTLEQETKAVEKAIFTVNKVLSMVPTMEKFSFFDKNEFTKNGLQALIKYVCEENEVSIDHVKKVAGWK
jgi:hypothetical protein